MNERDINRMEGSLGAALGALHAAGPLPAILLVVGIHAVAFTGYALYVSFTHETGSAYAWAALGVGFAFLLRKALSLAGLGRKSLRWATIAMLLVVAGRLEATAGTLGIITKAVTGTDADIAFYKATGVVLGPEAARVADRSGAGNVCQRFKGDHSLFNGMEWGVARTAGCMRFLTPEDGERSCKAFAATKAHFGSEDLRTFCGTWIKGAQLQPWDRPAPDKSRYAR